MTTKKDGGSSYYVEATGVTYRVCKMILKMNPTDIDQIVVGNTVYQGDSDICGNTDGLAMKFCFGSDGTICDGTGHGSTSGGSSGGTSGETSGGEEVGTTCDPSCGSCEQCIDGTCVSTCDACQECVDGTCVVQSCPITCSDTQQPSGTDECGCITGCEDKCPNLTCGTCELINYETCSCDVDSSCTCEERGGETIYYLTGTCCETPSSCCSLDDSCVQTECAITDNTQCGILCEEGAQTTSVCCTAVSIDGDDPMNHVWVGDKYGEGYCCVSSAESADCCEASNGSWCDGSCCVSPLTCVNGTCCHPDNQCDTTCCTDEQTCINGSCCETPNTDATECCASGVGTNGACCAYVDTTTCTNGTTSDDNGCTICQAAVTCANTETACSDGTNTWCCAEGNSCGTTDGQCCLGDICCEEGSFAYCPSPAGVSPTTATGDNCMSDYYGCCDGTLYTEIDDFEWTCCSAGGTVYAGSCTKGTSDIGSWEECLSDGSGDIVYGCCPAGSTISEVSYDSDLRWWRTCT